MKAATAASEEEPDLYKVLNLSPECTTMDIKKAFRSLAIRLHPDKLPMLSMTAAEQDAANRKYETIVLAFNVLSDPQTRKEYDQMYYIELRMKSHQDLKSEYQAYSSNTPTAPDVATHQKNIEERHADLLATFRERTLPEYTRLRNDAAITVSRHHQQQGAIVKRIERPDALIPTSIIKCQSIRRLGEMYCNNTPPVETITTMFDQPLAEDTNRANKPLKHSIETYVSETSKLQSLDRNKYSKEGDVILDYIITR